MKYTSRDTPIERQVKYYTNPNCAGFESICSTVSLIKDLTEVFKQRFKKILEMNKISTVLQTMCFCTFSVILV